MTEHEKDRIIEGKEERQKTMDKLSIKNSHTYTYEKDQQKEKKEKGQGSGCLSNVEKAREKNQEALDEQEA